MTQVPVAARHTPHRYCDDPTCRARPSPCQHCLALLNCHRYCRAPIKMLSIVCSGHVLTNVRGYGMVYLPPVMKLGLLISMTIVTVASCLHLWEARPLPERQLDLDEGTAHACSLPLCEDPDECDSSSCTMGYHLCAHESIVSDALADMAGQRNLYMIVLNSTIPIRFFIFMPLLPLQTLMRPLKTLCRYRDTRSHQPCSS